MASLKAIRKRIASVRSTQQITKAMKMVAAAKLRRAQGAAIASRPYASKLEAMVAHLASRMEENAHALLRVPEEDRSALVVLITGDRGLCGGYNSNLGRTTEAFVRDRGGACRLIAVGRKGAEYLRRRGVGVEAQHPMPVGPAAAQLARDLSRLAAREFVAASIDSVHLVYGAFRSALAQVPTIDHLLPFERHLGPAATEPHADYLFEPGPTEIIGFLLPRLLEVRILHGLLEAWASEQGARMTAMESATRNATEMIDRLTLEMNRARQAAITKELMEIIGGAEALKG